MNNQKSGNKPTDHEDGDHTQPINLVATRTAVPATAYSASSTAVVTQPLRPHIEPPKPGLMTLYFRTPTPRPQNQVMGPVVGTQVSSSPQHFTAKQAQDFKNSNISSWTVIRMPTSDIPQAQSLATTSNASGTVTPGILPSALTGNSNRHMIPSVHPVIAAGTSGPSMASIIRGSHQVSPAGHVIHPPYSSHVPRGPAAVASISSAPKSAVATPILRTPHSSATMALASSSMMALHTPVRAKSPTLVGRTATPPVITAASIPQVVDFQKSSIGHTLPSSSTHIGLGSRALDGSVVRTGATHSSSITIAKPINISQPIVQHLQQVYDKGALKTISNLASTTSTPSNSTPAHQTVVPGTTFTTISETVGIIPNVSRASVSTGYSTNTIMQLSSAAAVGQSLQQLRTTHVPQAVHAVNNVTTSVPSHQTLTVISAKSLMPTNHSIALTPSAGAATLNTSGTTSCSTSIIPGSTTRPLNAPSTISATTIPVAKVYPQSPATARPASEPPVQDVTRTNSFVTQPIVSSTTRVSTPTTAVNSGPQTVMITDKPTESNSPVRFTSLTKPQVGSATSYTPSPTTYLYHDQYPANLTVHPYSVNPTPQSFTATQLRPISFSQHASSNVSSHPSISVSNPVQPINSVMVAVDSRHHVALHPSYSSNSGTSKGTEVSTSMPLTSSCTGSSSSTAVTCVVTTSFNSLQTQAGVNNHTSPRPSILRKRTSESICNTAKRNLSGSMEPVSPRSELSISNSFASVLSPKPTSEKVKEAPAAVVPVTSDNQNASVAIIPPVVIKKEPGLSENICQNSNAIMKDLGQIEALPRKKPRKQLLAANELMETHSSEGEDSNFDVKVKIKEEPGIKDEDKTKYVTYYKRPTMSLLNSYRQTWKARHNHFARYSDVKPKEEKKATVNELANQKGILQQVNGWKVYHLSAQMDEVIGLEESVYLRLSHLLDFVEGDPPALKNKNVMNSDEDRIINKLTDLIKGNLQRSKIVQEQVTESKQQAIKVLDHKTNVIEMVNKYISKRPLKKKDKT